MYEYYDYTSIYVLYRSIAASGLELQDEAAKGGPVGNALSPLGSPIGSGGRRWGRWGEALHRIALLAPAAGAGVRILGVGRRSHCSLILLLLLAMVISGPNNLAAEGAEAEGVEEGAGADLARVGGGGGLGAATRLGPLVEEEHARAVDHVSLHPGDVQNLLDLRHPHHIVVR